MGPASSSLAYALPEAPRMMQADAKTLARGRLSSRVQDSAASQRKARPSSPLYRSSVLRMPLVVQGERTEESRTLGRYGRSRGAFDVDEVEVGLGVDDEAEDAAGRRTCL